MNDASEFQAFVIGLQRQDIRHFFKGEAQIKFNDFKLHLAGFDF